MNCDINWEAISGKGKIGIKSKVAYLSRRKTTYFVQLDSERTFLGEQNVSKNF